MMEWFPKCATKKKTNIYTQMSLQRGYENINDKRKDAEKEIGKKKWNR